MPRPLARRKTTTTAVTLGLAEDPVNPEHVVHHLVELHERHVQLLLVAPLEPGLGVVPQLAALHLDVVLAQPVREEDRPRERFLLVEVAELE